MGVSPIINELEGFLAILIVLLIIYFFVWRRSKIIGNVCLLLLSLSLLVPLGGTDYELIAWCGIFISFMSVLLEFGASKMGATLS